MVYETSTGMMIPEPKTFDKGLVYVKDTDILLPGDKWTVIVNIALDDYEALVKVMKDTLSQVRQRIQKQKNPKSYSFDIHWEEISRLKTMVRGFETDLQSFQKLLFEEASTYNSSSIVNSRAKRGLIDVLGYGMKYIFGTADARDVKRLAAVCNKLHTFELKMTCLPSSADIYTYLG